MVPIVAKPKFVAHGFLLSAVPGWWRGVAMMPDPETPPEDVKNVVLKIAQFVAKNGVRDARTPLFDVGVLARREEASKARVVWCVVCWV